MVRPTARARTRVEHRGRRVRESRRPRRPPARYKAPPPAESARDEPRREFARDREAGGEAAVPTWPGTCTRGNPRRRLRSYAAILRA